VLLAQTSLRLEQDWAMMVQKLLVQINQWLEKHWTPEGRMRF
jgi:hypothetical protein